MRIYTYSEGSTLMPIWHRLNIVETIGKQVIPEIFNDSPGQR